VTNPLFGITTQAAATAVAAAQASLDAAVTVWQAVAAIVPPVVLPSPPLT